MSSQSKQVALQFYESVNDGDLKALRNILSVDFIDHVAGQEDSLGAEAFFKFLGMVTETFPDIQVAVEDVFADGDKVAARVSIRGTQEGAFVSIEPTGKRAEWTGIDILEVSEGKITERWSQRDFMSLINQLESK
jgi:steroid delta-isomerase-like uncharacterized protein